MITQSKQRVLKALLIVGATLLVCQVLYATLIKERFILALNETTSLPDAVFVIDKNRSIDTVTKGDVIGFKFKQQNNLYYQYGHNFIKKVACMPGDELSVRESVYFCNGIMIGVAKNSDSQGRKVDKFFYTGEIPEGKYFVMGSSTNSYDSRYWGFVDREDVIGVSIW